MAEQINQAGKANEMYTDVETIVSSLLAAKGHLYP